MNKRLYRSRTDSWLGGVAGGIAEYFGIDPTIVRLVWLAMIFAFGTGLLLYIIAWVIIPPSPEGPTNPRFEQTEQWRETVIQTAKDVESRFKGEQAAGTGHSSQEYTAQWEPAGGSASSAEPSASRGARVIGWLLIVLGALLFLWKIIPIAWYYVGPVALIALGVIFILQGVRR